MFEVVVNTAWPARKASTYSNRSCQAESPVPALLASDPLALVLADAPAPALLALAPDALVRADAHAPALLAQAPSALVLADAPAPSDSKSKFVIIIPLTFKSNLINVQFESDSYNQMAVQFETRFQF